MIIAFVALAYERLLRAFAHFHYMKLTHFFAYF